MFLKVCLIILGSFAVIFLRFDRLWIKYNCQILACKQKQRWGWLGSRLSPWRQTGRFCSRCLWSLTFQVGNSFRKVSLMQTCKNWRETQQPQTWSMQITTELYVKLTFLKFVKEKALGTTRLVLFSRKIARPGLGKPLLNCRDSFDHSTEIGIFYPTEVILGYIRLKMK